jgi:hypothetical protein
VKTNANFKTLGPRLERYGFDFQEIQGFSADKINQKQWNIRVVIGGKA